MRQAIDRRRFLGTVGAGAAAALTASLGLGKMTWGQGGGAARKPNILVILADDLGYAGLGVQGCPDIPTPNIDSIARAGVRFTNGYVSCPLCSPTRAGLQTGRYQQRFGHERNPGPAQVAAADFGLPRTEVTLAERLKPLGYATGMVGKWHLGYNPGSQPLDRGYDEFFGFLGGANEYLIGTNQRQAGTILRGRESVPEREYLTDAFGREACAFIDRHHAAPFLLYLPFNAVHAPLQAADKYLQRFGQIADPNRRTHAAMLAAMDDNVGRVLGKLREHGLEEQTLVFFLSDNGGPTPKTTSSNLPLRGYKGEMWEGGIRIPFMLQWKGKLDGGKVCDWPAISLDILPTAVAAAGGEVAAQWQLDGADLLPYLTGSKAGTPHETLYWRMGDKHAIRQGDWKVVVETGEPGPHLHNLAQDISETADLAAQMPAKLAELTGAWEAWSGRMMAPRWGGRARAGDADGGEGTAGAPRRTAMQRLRRLDKDHDGRLTPDEVPNQKLFGRLDANGDGVITREEARAGLGAQGAK